MAWNNLEIVNNCIDKIEWLRIRTRKWCQRGSVFSSQNIWFQLWQVFSNYDPNSWCVNFLSNVIGEFLKRRAVALSTQQKTLKRLRSSGKHWKKLVKQFQLQSKGKRLRSAFWVFKSIHLAMAEYMKRSKKHWKIIEQFNIRPLLKIWLWEGQKLKKILLFLRNGSLKSSEMWAHIGK